MIDYIITFLFIISVAVASGSILIAYQLKERFKYDYLSSLMYMQVFFFTFGLYAIWGQVLIKTLLSMYISAEMMSRISNILIYLGTPFLVFGWYMLIRFGKELSGRSNSNSIFIIFLIINVLMFSGLGYCINKLTQFKPLDIIKYYYISLNILYTSIGVVYMLSSSTRDSKIPKHFRQKLALFFLGLVMAEDVLIYFYNESNLSFALIFIFLYFTGSGFITVYMKYQIAPEVLAGRGEYKLSFNEFCSNHEITAREKEIILEIYNGLTNQQIANKLYISIQTVKDHTSRIYNKTNTQNRVQLIKMLHESEEVK